jgi:ribose 5-phosphate isomerase A
MELKKSVGYEAAQLVDNGNVVGLGTGSTASYFIEKLGHRIKQEQMEILGVPTSYQSFFLAKKAEIPITTIEEHDVDIAVDGADEVDKHLNLIKGGGAAHTMEKIIDEAAERFIVIVDDSKVVNTLGGIPVPIEVIPKARRIVYKNVKKLGGIPNLRKFKSYPLITENNNFIIDVKFKKIGNPKSLEAKLNNIPGIVENGIFSGVVEKVLVGTNEGVSILEK